MKNGDSPAYPTAKTTIVQTEAGNAVQNASKVAGLTKREWFAGMALQGIMAHPDTKYSINDKSADMYLREAVYQALFTADILLNEL
jgi:hypothetical protein